MTSAKTTRYAIRFKVAVSMGKTSAELLVNCTRDLFDKTYLDAEQQRMFSTKTKIGGSLILLIVAVVVLFILVVYYRRKSTTPKKSSYEHSVRYTPNEIDSDEEEDINKRVWRPDFPASPIAYPTKESKVERENPTNRIPTNPMSEFRI